MTDKATLDRLIADAKHEVVLAGVHMDTLAPNAPLRYKVEASKRLKAAWANLDALEELEPEDPEIS